MDLFFHDLSFQATLGDFERAFAALIHSPRYLPQSRQPWNFSVHLFPPLKNQPGRNHRGCGTVTIPSKELGQALLRDLDPRKIKLLPSKVEPKPIDIERLREATKQSFQRNTLGWETRSGVLSVEWEKLFQEACHLSFSDTRRELRIRLFDQQDIVRSVAVPWSQISWSATGHRDIFLSLSSPPTFDIEHSGQRRRLLTLYPDDSNLTRVLPYATLAIRLVCREASDLKVFKELCKIARLPAPKDFAYRAEPLDLFSETRLEQYSRWASKFEWSVAFQLEALLRGRFADAKELLSIHDIVDSMVLRKGTNYTARFLRSVITAAEFGNLSNYQEEFKASVQVLASDFSWSPERHPWEPKDGAFHCYHVSVSPTSMKLEGPLPERSNRVMRTYADNIDSFIRVSFHDREIDGPAFVNDWVSPVLRNGITIAGRSFKFLAYSQSALKSHTVWFVSDFTDTKAFTTTDSSITVPAEEIIVNTALRTGVGTISKSLARKIWKALQKRGSRSTRRAITYPRAFQVRVVGAKGMLSVDYRLLGDVVVLRDSMIKFEAPHSTDVEIAQAFVRPSKYYLNRPLIMLLEGLGIKCDVFMKLQDAAVQDVNEATTSLESAANTLDQYGLATSYRLSSTLLHLAKLGLSPLDLGDFYDQMITYAIHHILRDLKHHARIPVHDGYTLVGVADVHRYLQEGEVFACVSMPETNVVRYLEGPVLVSRSPVIHPGDVQVVRAIGRPPPGSPFATEPLVNTVVFSVNGDRPLPSYLGGGDLDGDTYNVTFLKDLHPPQNHPPGAYDPAPKKLLDRPSTMDDVADFVTHFMILINRFSTDSRLADLHDIFHEDCRKLCQIHSDAVDYPKSGTPVAPNTVPRPRYDHKPDWHAPETVNLDNSINFYQSQKAIGMALQSHRPCLRCEYRTIVVRRQRQHVREDASQPDLDDVFAALCIGDRQDDALEVAVKNRVAEFIDVDPHSQYVELAIDSLGRYSIDLQGICASNVVQRQKTAMLSEEEAAVGTIVAKCSQRPAGANELSRKAVQEELQGGDETSQYEWLAAAWAAWKVSRHLEDRFGAHSYGWIALGELFGAMKAIEQEETSLARR
ncbi:RdRP-domain-containing protein [Lactarius deliciosus]|nr:RdRP-domain-containing protein [Lactarius deliciosus]